ncbi:MAG: HmuY family protein [Flavobacteriales bacterium]|nr:HmuY family protein [Flavobacteriales bacterium]MBP9080979.1 HmuY family protein [Flavobacteriales bacterium]
MKNLFSLGVVLCGLVFTGCLKEEIPVPKAPRGGVVECVAQVGPAYDQQLWFDLGSYSVVAQNSKMDWDVAFECAPDGWQVRLNYARLMRAHKSDTELGQPADTAGFGNTWKVDLPNGRTDSLALGDWRSDHPVYIVDMGYNTAGLPMGLRKLQVTAVSPSAYEFTVANLDGSATQQFTVPKDPARAYAHFSFSNGVATIAPPLGAYDLVFTQYTEQFLPPEPYMAYLVTGTVNGFSGARVAELTGDFAQITLADTLAQPFTTDQDAIGYNWKDYSFDSGLYEVYSNKVYIVQDREGYFFKLHFVDYYDAQGQRGSPKFEVMPL